MALEYVVTKRVFGFDKDKNEKYVAKSVVPVGLILQRCVAK